MSTAVSESEKWQKAIANLRDLVEPSAKAQKASDIAASIQSFATKEDALRDSTPSQFTEIKSGGCLLA